MLDKCPLGEFSIACLVRIYTKCYGLIWKNTALPVELALPVCIESVDRHSKAFLEQRQCLIVYNLILCDGWTLNSLKQTQQQFGAGSKGGKGLNP